MTAALAAGAKRRALVMAMPATPAPGQAQKRALQKASPGATVSTTASPATVTPDAKRLMTASSSDKGVPTTAPVDGSGELDPVSPTIPAELFPDNDVNMSPAGRWVMGKHVGSIYVIATSKSLCGHVGIWKRRC